MNQFLSIAPEVVEAIQQKRPVVALESTIIAHGMAFPENAETALAVEKIIRDEGAVPATIAVRAGRLKVGLSATEIETLARNGLSIAKLSTRDLPHAVALARDGATTVASTMRVAALAGIRVFATGGIGGVHRGALGIPGSAGPPTLDVSSDLEELARTPLAVVCAGPKAILDVPLTLEYLETRGVPVVAIGQRELPGFYARSSGIGAPIAVDDVEAAARSAALHLGLGLGSAILLCVPVPSDAALPEDVARDAVEQAIAEAEASAVHGPALTPWLLARVAVLTEGASVRANTALIVNDARVAGQIAARLP